MNAPQLPNSCNPPFTSPLYTKGACPLIAHTTFFYPSVTLRVPPPICCFPQTGAPRQKNLAAKWQTAGDFIPLINYLTVPLFKPPERIEREQGV